MHYFIEAFTKNYVNFAGRARRKEYWMFVLFNCIAAFVVGFIAGLLEVSLLSGIYSLAVLLPALGVTIRRLHDTGRNWPWIFIGFIPVVGQIWLFVLMVLDSQPGANQYGPNPKGVEA